MPTEIRVYYKDTDAGGVVYYANYLNFFEIARTEFLRQQGLVVEDYVAQGILFMVVEAQLKYHSPARYGDVLAISAEISELRKASLVFRHQITRRGQSELLAEGSARLACVNASGKPMKMPPEFFQKLQMLSAPA